MKIDNLPGPGAPKTTGARATPSTPAATDKGQGRDVKAPRDDSVTLTDTARRLGELKNQLGDMPVVDSQRVERVRQAIDDGGYQIAPARVADKIFQFEFK